MTVIVKLKAFDITPSETVSFEQADKYQILDDNTIELQMNNPETGKYRVIGHVNHSRWDTVTVLQDSRDGTT